MFRAVNWEEITFKRTIGKTVEGRDIIVFGEKTFDFGAAMPNSTLLIGGMHGDETATVVLLEDFLARYLGTEAWCTPTVVLPLANPDSYFLRSRYNARGVDLTQSHHFVRRLC